MSNVQPKKRLYFFIYFIYLYVIVPSNVLNEKCCLENSHYLKKSTKTKLIFLVDFETLGEEGQVPVWRFELWTSNHSTQGR